MIGERKMASGRNKYRLKVIILLSFLGLVRSHSMAQTDAFMSQYYEIPTLYNPAAAGSSGDLRFRGAGRLQWTGTENNPRNFALIADMPLTVAGRGFGIGLRGFSQSEGPLRMMSAGMQAGYRFRLGGGSLTAALEGRYGNGRLKRSERRDHAFSLGAGLFYAHPSFWAGISGLDLNSPVMSFVRRRPEETVDPESTEESDVTETENVEIKTKRTVCLMAGGNIPLSATLFELLPSVIMKSDFDRLRGELTGRLRYKKLISFGVGYRFDDAVVLTLAAEIKGFFIGYSYDCPVSSWSKKSDGSHEIVAGYSVKLDFRPKEKNKYKSIRIM